MEVRPWEHSLWFRARAICSVRLPWSCRCDRGVFMKFKNRDIEASRETPNEFAKDLFKPLPRRYNLLAWLFSFAQDRRWRLAMLDHVICGAWASPTARRRGWPSGSHWSWGGASSCRSPTIHSTRSPSRIYCATSTIRKRRLPTSSGWKVLWWFYTRAVLPLGGLITGGKGWWDVGRFLGPSISKHYRSYPVDWTVGAWEHAGVEHVEHRSMSLGGGLV